MCFMVSNNNILFINYIRVSEKYRVPFFLIYSLENTIWCIPYMCIEIFLVPL